MVGSAWWVLTWFLYIKTNTTDADLNPATPLSWFWANLTSNSDGWMATSYMSTFVGYLIVSFVEFLAWILYSVDLP